MRQEMAVRYLAAIVLTVLAQHPAGAEVLIGTATLNYQGPSKYQPCESLAHEIPLCLDIGSWLRHEAVEFRDLNGQVHNVTSIVGIATFPLSGEWFLVLERLSDEDAVKFESPYKVVDRSRLIKAVCLKGPFEKYTGSEMTTPKLVSSEKSHCYDIQQLPRN